MDCKCWIYLVHKHLTQYLKIPKSKRRTIAKVLVEAKPCDVVLNDPSEKKFESSFKTIGSIDEGYRN